MNETAAELTASRGRLTKILDGLGALAGLLELDGTLIEANRLALDPAGLQPTDVLGKKFWDCYWWNYDPAIQDELKRAIERACQGTFVRYDVDVRMRDDQLVTIDFQLAPLRDDSGRITHLIPSGIEITERRQAEEALRESEARFRHLANAVPDIVWTAGPDGSITYVNDRWFHFSGIAPERNATVRPGSVLHEEDRTRCREHWLQALRTGTEYEVEVRLRRHDGNYRWFLTRAVPARNTKGQITSWFGSTIDIHERKKAEETQKLLIDELNHRVRNTLTVIKSIAAQTRRHSETLEAFGTAFEGRIHALAATHTLLADGKWQASGLQALIEEQLHGYRSRPDAVALDGPAVSIEPKPALALSLVFHELATNAARYGALSNASGRIDVSWNIVGGDAGDRLHLVWQECGGPLVKSPTRTGLGSKLIDFNITHEFEGYVDRRYYQDGFICDITIPWSKPLDAS